MADPRETILAQLVVIAQGVDGVVSAVRNAVDAPNIERPTFLIHDGAETFLSKPISERRSRVQLIELTPQIVILAAASPVDLGTLLNSFRARFLSAVLADAVLLSVIPLTGDGEIRYEGCTFEPSGAESREGRMELHFVFTYVFRASDL
jgi:hypothetical protein